MIPAGLEIQEATTIHPEKKKGQGQSRKAGEGSALGAPEWSNTSGLRACVCVKMQMPLASSEVPWGMGAAHAGWPDDWQRACGGNSGSLLSETHGALWKMGKSRFSRCEKVRKLVRRGRQSRDKSLRQTVKSRTSA